jgi:NADPH:quinone reductase-like Zn-dependent oxidoreductase
VGEGVSQEWIRQRAWCYGAQTYTRVIATCRSQTDKEIASRAGADEVLLTDEKLIERIRSLAPDGVHHIVEVALAANIKIDVDVLAQGAEAHQFVEHPTKSGRVVVMI